LGTVVTVVAADVQGAPSGSLYASTCDATQRHALWFSYTTGANDVMLAVGIKGAESGDAYHPVMSVWTGTPPSVTQHKVLSGSGGTLNALCASFALATTRSDIWYFSFPVSANTTYYFQVTDANSSTVTTDLHVVGVAQPTGTAKPGDYLIINDAGPFPGAVVDQTTGQLLGYIGTLGNGEEGASLQSGQTSFQATNLNTPTGAVQIVNRALGTIATINGAADNILNSATVFYVITFTGDTAHVQLVNPDGTLGVLVDVPSVGGGLLVSADSDIFYYTDDATFTLIQRWNLLTNLAMTDFAGSFGGAEPLSGFVSGQTGLLCFVYAGSPKVLRQFYPSGMLISTSNLPADASRIIGDLGSDTFQVWNGTTGFTRYALWAPTVALVSVTAPGAQSSNGGPQNAPYAVSTSCPLLVIPSASPVIQQEAFAGQLGDVAMKRLRRAPHLSNEQLINFYKSFQVDCTPGTGLVTGQGSEPEMMMRFSDDGGHTWSQEMTVSLGLNGAYQTRAMWRSLGSSRDRIFEVSISDPVFIALLDAFIDVEQGIY
jgi:hypothetical protein